MEKNLINSIINIMENYYVKHKTLVPMANIDSVNDKLVIEPEVIDVLEANPMIFYRSTARRYALVKWILDIIEKMFEESNRTPIFIRSIYDRLRMEFKVNNINRRQLNRLLKEDNILTYEKFNNLQKDYNNNLKLVVREKNTSAKNNIYLTDVLKAAINSIFSEKIYKEIANEQKNTNIELTNEEREIIDKIVLAKDELGAENCYAFLEDSNLSLTIYKLLFPIANKYIEFKKNQDEIDKLLDSINPGNREARIEWLVRAYTLNNDIQSTLIKIFNKYGIRRPNQIKLDLKSLLEIEVSEINILINFVKWLSRDLQSDIWEELKDIFKDSRGREILLKRAQDYTLDLIGKEFNLTRERVRQVEKKLIDKFKKYINRIRPQYILLAFSDKNYIISRELIKSVYHDLANAFEYCLRTIESKSAIWNDDLESFINDDAKWYNYVVQCIDSFPEMLNTDELHQEVFKLYNSLEVRIDLDIIKTITEKSYKLIGNIYTKKKMSKKQMYLIIVKKYFPNGIKIFDDFEMMRFNEYFKEEFGEIELTNNRAIAVRMADGLILCDRGRYTLPDKINIPDDLLQKIFDYVKNSSKNIIMYHELFEIFKEELLKNSNIDNRYFLHGVLKYKYPDSFIYTRDTICKESAEVRSIRYEIEEFIKHADRVVTKEDIKTAFPGITDIMINLHITGNENVLLWGFGEYIHISKLNLEDETVERLGNALREYTKDGTVTVHKIYSELFNLENELMINNNITNHVALFSLLQYLFGEEYEFSRPYIAPKNSTTLSEDALIREYVSNFNQLTISDLKTYLNDMHIRIMNYTALLDDLSPEFLRVDDDLLMRTNQLELSEETINRIEQTLLALMGQAGYISSKVLSDFFFFPNVGVKWTPFLLISIIKSFGKQIRIIDINTDYRYLNSIFVDSSLNIVDYDSLLYHAIKQEADVSKFKSMTEIEQFLQERGLISNNIPEFFLEKGYLVSDALQG